MLAIVAAIIILGAGARALGVELTNFKPDIIASPNLPLNLIEPMQSWTSPGLSTANTATATPTQTPTPTLMPPSASASFYGIFELTISVEKDSYEVGEPINITLAITNISNKTVNFTHTGMDFDFIVTDDNNNLVYQWSTGKAFPMFVMLEPLGPDENVTATYVWAQTCNSNPSSVSTQVAPGTYYIVGKSDSIYELQTKPVQITIISS